MLRARDRWPRQYVNLTGISNQPKLGYSLDLTLSHWPLNNVAGPFRESSLGPLSRSQESAYNYSIEPLSPDSINDVVLTPISQATFARYWNETLWPRELLLLVMVRSVKRPDGSVLSNFFTAGECGGGQSCAVAPTTEARCAFYRWAQAAAAATRESAFVQPTPPPCRTTQTLTPDGDNADLIEALNTTAQNSGGQMRLRLAENGVGVVVQRCNSDPPATRLTDGASAVTYEVTLRSIDDMVYALGTLLRDEGAAPALVHPCRGCNAAALFRVIDQSGQDSRLFAARADFGDQRYVAGPQVRDPNAASHDGSVGDQTASVITLLTQLFTLNVEAPTSSPPERVNTN